jgi:hypothetical protein
MDQTDDLQNAAANAIEDENLIERASGVEGVNAPETGISEMPGPAQIRLARELVEGRVQRCVKPAGQTGSARVCIPRELAGIVQVEELGLLYGQAHFALFSRRMRSPMARISSAEYGV